LIFPPVTTKEYSSLIVIAHEKRSPLSGVGASPPIRVEMVKLIGSKASTTSFGSSKKR